MRARLPAVDVKKRAKTKAAKKKTTRKTTACQETGVRKRLKVNAESPGLASEDIALKTDSLPIIGLVDEVRSAGGAPLGTCREPLSSRPMLLASLPIESVQPTPFRRDLSPTHTKRLAQKIEESGSFSDAIIVVRSSDGQLWTPNGRHRLAADKMLGLRQIAGLVSPDEDLAFRILALNAEKTQNLKGRSLEVIRMAQELAQRRRRARELDFIVEFDAASVREGDVALVAAASGGS